MKKFSNWQKCSSLLTALLFFCATTLPIGCGSEEEVAKVADTQSPTEQYAYAERMEYWIVKMDPFVSQNADWTFTLDWEGFLFSVTANHPEVVAYFENVGEPTEDTEIIEMLRGGIKVLSETTSQHSYSTVTSSRLWSCFSECLEGYWDYFPDWVQAICDPMGEWCADGIWWACATYAGCVMGQGYAAWGWLAGCYWGCR